MHWEAVNGSRSHTAFVSLTHLAFKREVDVKSMTFHPSSTHAHPSHANANAFARLCHAPTCTEDGHSLVYAARCP